MKTNVLQKLPAPSLPSDKALRDVLASVVAVVTKISELRQRLAREKTEVEECIRTCDADDPKALAALAGMRDRVEILPHMIGREDARAKERVSELIAVANRFESELIAALRTCAAERKTAIAEAIEPLFPGEVSNGLANPPDHRAERVAATSPHVLELLVLADRVDGSRHESASQSAQWQTELPEAVEALLELAKEAERL